MNPMQKISIYYAGLTKAEKSTCDLILDHPEIVIENPIAEAARLYNVSPSSILRLSKKLEYKGYSEFIKRKITRLLKINSMRKFWILIIHH